MVNFLNSWAQRIIVVIIICTIIEMILPKGKNKNYIKTVIGIYVVFTIISPIISKLNGNINFDKYLNIKNNYNSTIEVSSNINTNEYVEKVYKGKLEQDIKNKLSDINYDVNNIEIEVETSDNSMYGDILKLKLQVSEKNKENKNEIKINTIQIGETKAKTKISSEEADTIKKYLSEAYNIDVTKIDVR